MAAELRAVDAESRSFEDSAAELALVRAMLGSVPHNLALREPQPRPETRA